MVVCEKIPGNGSEEAIQKFFPEKFLEDNPDYNGTIIDSSWTSLKEDGEEIGLIDNNEEIIEQFIYLPCPDTSLQKIDLANNSYDEDNWQIHPDSHTAGQENYFESNEDNEEDDSNNDDDNEEDENNENNSGTGIIVPENQETENKPDYKSMLIISEIFPNPAGSDLHYEFIEIKNISDFEISLSDWKIQDEDKNTYKLPYLTITPYQYYVIERKSSGIALNNDKDTLKLISPEDKTIQTIKYQENPQINEKASYALNSKNEWEWTDTVTKGYYNTIKPMNHPPIIEIYCPKEAEINKLIICDASDSYDTENNNLTFKWEIAGKVFPNPIVEFSLLEKGKNTINLTIADNEFTVTENHELKIYSNQEDIEDNTEIKKSDKDSDEIKQNEDTPTDILTEVTLADIRKIAKGSQVKTRGVVSVPPNLFGKTTMYLAGSGIQLYMYKSNWPELSIGDLVEVQGKLTESKNETRIKLKENKDIIIIEKQEPPEPHEININNINETTEGYLVQIHGQLIEKSSSKFYVQDETGEAEVYIKTNTKINKSTYKEGDELKINGIISQNNDIYQLLPRFSEDITKIETIEKKEEPIVMVQNTKNNQVMQ